MKLLLDTHAFLWFINDSSSLNAYVKRLIESDAEVLVSIASLWEVVIKIRIGKLSLPENFDPFIPQQLAHNEFDILPIDLNHLSALCSLPLQHRDPFDRLLVAQAIVEQLPIISADKIFDLYAVERLWEEAERNP